MPTWNRHDSCKSNGSSYTRPDSKNNSNTTTTIINNNKNLFAIGLFWSLLTLTSAAVQSAAIYSNVDFLANPKFEPICSEQQEQFIESEGKESSILLEFSPGPLAAKTKSCTRILSAPTNYGFIVRLILPKIRHGIHQTSAGMASDTASSSVADIAASDRSKASTFNEMTTLIQKLNATALKSKSLLGRTCPLNIFSSLDPHIPQWRLDPCQLEDTAPDMEDPVRLFHGRVRIVWEHGHNVLKSKLMVTALGKGNQCRSDNKHQCLKIGEEPILCISKDLVCDGIRHCPYSNEYDSDEDYAMCWKRRRFGEPIPPAMESDIFEHFALEVFRNLFANDAPTMPESSNGSETNGAAPNSTTLRKVEGKEMPGEATVPRNSTSVTKVDNTTESSANGTGRRNSTRTGLNSDLSKYGPWGYLMLGMLLCGGALLICGLWASATQHAANNERESALQNSTANGFHGGSLENSNAGPPNYEELDPPPAYAVLFPNQKAASNATLSSLATAATIAAAPPLSPTAAATSGAMLAAATAPSPSPPPPSPANPATPPDTGAVSQTPATAHRTDEGSN